MVAPAFRRLGLASLLMKHAMDFCQQQNFTSVDLLTCEAQVSLNNVQLFIDLITPVKGAVALEKSLNDGKVEFLSALA